MLQLCIVDLTCLFKTGFQEISPLCLLLGEVTRITKQPSVGQASSPAEAEALAMSFLWRGIIGLLILHFMLKTFTAMIRVLLIIY